MVTDRDPVEKRADCADAGIAEYWIADPCDETITVLALKGEAYVEHATFARRDTATSRCWKGSLRRTSLRCSTPRNQAPEPSSGRGSATDLATLSIVLTVLSQVAACCAR